MGDPLQIEIDVDGLDAVPDGLVMITVGSSTTQCLFRMTSRMRRLPAAHERCTHETIVVTSRRCRSRRATTTSTCSSRATTSAA